MNQMYGSFPIRLFVVACYAIFIPIAISLADENPAPQPEKNAAVEPSKGSPANCVQPKASLRTERVHPQVSQSFLLREYRSLSVPSGPRSFLASGKRIRESLDHQVPQPQWQFKETPLRDVVATLQETVQIPVDIDIPAFEDVGIDVDLPVTFNPQGGTVRSALRRILEDLGLTWIIRDECLVITTQDRADELLFIRVYPLPLGYAANAWAEDFQSLTDLIRNTIRPYTWNSVGGAGSIEPSRGELRALVVSNNTMVHEELEELMQSLNTLGLAELGVLAENPGPQSPIVRIHAVADAKVRVDLEQKLVELCNTSLAKGADSAARVTAVGDCLAVQSVSPEFHILAGQLIRGVAGVSVRVPDDAAPGYSLGGAF